MLGKKFEVSVSVKLNKFKTTVFTLTSIPSFQCPKPPTFKRSILKPNINNLPLKYRYPNF